MSPARQQSVAQHRKANLYQQVLRPLWDRIAFGICMSIDRTSQHGDCDAVACAFVTHHLIVKPVQNLP
jgi:hypothetical protein